MRLAIELAREAEFDQFLAHGVGADRMSQRRQRCSEFVHALGDPYQGPHGIAQGRGFDQPLEFRNEAGINLGNRPTPAALRSRTRGRRGIRRIPRSWTFRVLDDIRPVRLDPRIRPRDGGEHLRSIALGRIQLVRGCDHEGERVDVD
jgi:hypothetical protein